jgi:hypothetical protein
LAFVPLARWVVYGMAITALGLIMAMWPRSEPSERGPSP